MAVAFDTGSLWAFAQVIMIDLVLAGDNAVVIGMAAAGLPSTLRRKAILWGIVAATLDAHLACGRDDATSGGRRPLVGGRVVAALGGLESFGRNSITQPSRSYGQKRPWPKLIWTPMALSARQRQPKAIVRRSSQIMVADISMSLDNVLAVAGAAREHPAALVFGLALSIALMGLAAAAIARLLNRHRWIAYVGLVVIVIVALRMIVQGAEELMPSVRASLTLTA